MAALGREHLSRMGLEIAARLERAQFSLDVELRAESGEVVAVVGPNGAGKSTLLRIVAGLLGVTSGRIALDGTLLDDPVAGTFVEAARRRVGVVFQDHRLFPHLRVIDNVAYGLRARGVARKPARAAAAEQLAALGLDEFARRRPRELSGGQAQRVALARALASEPEVLLLDEPLSALDVRTRADVQAELQAQLAGFAGPTLIVTHDPIEALLLATRIVVLERGRVVQEGPPAEIAGRPATSYVASLVGMNLLAGRAYGGLIALDGGGQLHGGDGSGRVLVALRPSALTVHTSEPHDTSARNVWAGRIDALAPLADRIRLSVTGAPSVLVDVTPSAVAELGLRPGREVWLSAKATDLSVYPHPQSG